MLRRLPFYFIAGLLAGCSSPTATVYGPGGLHGGVLNLNETQVVRTLFPLAVTLVSEQHVAAQVYEGLVAFNPENLGVEAALAESWELDTSRTVYTFKLREGVRFHNDPAFPDGVGRELVADDVVHCFTSICEKGVGDAVFWLFQEKVKGADEYYASGKADGRVEGIEAVDDRTVRITLVRPVPSFLQRLAGAGCWIWPRELPAKYGNQLFDHAIGTGPFRLKVARAGEAIVLERNPAYWGRDAQGGQLPYLDAVRITLVPDKEKEIEAFMNGHLSMVTELSLESIGVLADSLDPRTGMRRFRMSSTAALAIQFYGFNLSKPPFNDVRVRRAFALALDRQKLVQEALQGLAVTADRGIVPPGLAGYPYEVVSGNPYNPDSARRLLDDAGYPGGKGFPRVQLQVSTHGFGYRNVASMAQEMLGRELGVAIVVNTVHTKEYYDRIERGEALFWREGWVADLPAPENFLALLYGKNAEPDTSLPSTLNTTRYASPRFDSLFAAANNAVLATDRMRNLALAEQVAMHDVPLIPLYHERYITLSSPTLQGLHSNALEILDLRRVHFRPDAQHGRPATTS
ncbi:MAG TPA: ABC transporter substrate-binding protein [Flavobacteriales bacterium]|nr:ABC transporter substrate-binding protein [Flavobacteriales bacterium]